MTVQFLGVLLAGAVTAGTPLLLAGLGEQISEKAGVLNVGLEGMMLAGAYGGFLAAYRFQSFWLGFGFGAACGTAVAALMALLCVRLALNQIVVGVALTLGAQGLTALLHHAAFSRSYPRLPRPDALDVPVLRDLPVLGPGLFRQHALVYAAALLVPALGWLFRDTQFGLHLHAAGARPAALDAAGGDVVRTRVAAVLLTGALAGLGGAYMAEIGAGLFVPFLTGGAGFIAIVLAMLARGRPLFVLLAALLFGASLALTTAVQVAGLNVPTDAVQMLPFALVLAALAAFGRRDMLPAALGTGYGGGA